MDTRKVQTAVLGSPDSDRPVYLPRDLADADYYFFPRHRDEQFFCGIWLGGCGNELTAKRGKWKVCHFAHFPGTAEDCDRPLIEEDSADHLYIHHGLTALLGLNGQRFSGTMRDRRCADLLVGSKRRRSAFRIQLANLAPEVQEREEAELRGRFGSVEWFVGMKAETTARYLIARNGKALRISCTPGGGTRIVHVAMDTGDPEIEWFVLEDCTVDGSGIVVPSTGGIRQPRWHSPTGNAPSPAAQRQVPSPPWSPGALQASFLTDHELRSRLGPVMSKLRKALQQKDRDGAVQILQDNEDLVKALRRSELFALQRSIREIREWALPKAKPRRSRIGKRSARKNRDR